MHLDEVLQLFRSTTPDDWHRVDAYAGFTYHQSIEATRGTENTPPVIAPSEHNQYAVCKRDVALSLAWGHNTDRNPFDLSLRPGEQLDWTPSFWGEVHEHYADLFYNNVLVWRFSYLMGDGGRMFLPWQKSKETGGTPPEFTPYFDRQDVEDIWLIALIGGADEQELEDRLRMTRLQVVNCEDEVVAAPPEPTE